VPFSGAIELQAHPSVQLASLPLLVERFFNEPKHFRAIATQYDQHDDNFLVSVQLFSIRIWLRHHGMVT